MAEKRRAAVRTSSAVGTPDSPAERELARLVVVPSGNPDMDSVKMPVMLAALRLVASETGTELCEGRRAILAVPPVGGDWGWFKATVLHYADPTGVAMTDVDGAVERMRSVYEREGGTPDRLGLAVLEGLAERMYMAYEVLR